MYRKSYHTHHPVPQVDGGPPTTRPNPSPAELTWGLAAAFAPIWLSIIAGFLIALAGNSSYLLGLACLVLIPLIGCAGLFTVFRPGLLLGSILLLYLPIGALTTAVIGWLSMVNVLW